MKTPVLISALAAGLAAAAPPSAGAAWPNPGALSANRDMDRYLVLAEQRRDCQGWAAANRNLLRRFHRVRLRRLIHNKEGEKVFIVHVRTTRGRYYRVRYNACARRITEVKRLRRMFCRKGRRLRSCLGIVRTRP